MNTEDLIDANEVANILGLAQPNSVSLYQRRYPDMPRPVVNLGPNRPLLWLRPEVERWATHRPAVQRGRPKNTAQSEAAKSPSASPTSARRRRKG